MDVATLLYSWPVPVLLAFQAFLRGVHNPKLARHTKEYRHTNRLLFWPECALKVAPRRTHRPNLANQYAVPDLLIDSIPSIPHRQLKKRVR